MNFAGPADNHSERGVSPAHLCPCTLTDGDTGKLSPMVLSSGLSHHVRAGKAAPPRSQDSGAAPAAPVGPQGAAELGHPAAGTSRPQCHGQDRVSGNHALARVSGAGSACSCEVASNIPVESPQVLPVKMWDGHPAGGGEGLRQQRILGRTNGTPRVWMYLQRMQQGGQACVVTRGVTQ